MSINQWHCVLINNNLWNKHAQYHDNLHLLDVKYKLERVHGDEKTSNKACDGILWHYNNMWPSWEKLAYGILCENRVWCILDNLYHRASLCSSFRPIVHSALEVQRLVCDRAKPPIIEKLPSKGTAMYTCSIFVYYIWTGNQLNEPGQNCSK